MKYLKLEYDPEIIEATDILKDMLIAIGENMLKSNSSREMDKEEHLAKAIKHMSRSVGTSKTAIRRMLYPKRVPNGNMLVCFDYAHYAKIFRYIALRSDKMLRQDSEGVRASLLVAYEAYNKFYRSTGKDGALDKKYTNTLVYDHFWHLEERLRNFERLKGDGFFKGRKEWIETLLAQTRAKDFSVKF